MHAIAYNAIRALILRSAREHGCELERASFKAAPDLMHQRLPKAAEFRDQPPKLARCNDELLEAIAQARNPEPP